MRLSRLFGGKPDEPQKPEDPEQPEAEALAEDTADDGAEYDGVPEGDVDADLDLQWRARAADVIPGGASTGSKRADALYGEGTTFGPTHYTRASGCHVTTAGGRTLIDCTMALGSVAIGYADDTITRAVLNAAALGSVAGLSHTSDRAPAGRGAPSHQRAVRAPVRECLRRPRDHRVLQDSLSRAHHA